MFYQMLTGRIILLMLCSGIAIYYSFRQTPELNKVENAWIYRLSLAMLIIRGLGYIAFDLFGLFPVD